MSRYILAVDQSTQGTKGLLFDGEGKLVRRADRPHRQIVNDLGYVEHDPEEILKNTLAVCADVIGEAGIDPASVAAMGISNQRETSAAWNRETGKPVMNAIVWQCARAAEICRRHEEEAELIRRKTGMTLSPYFPASKLQWIMENVPEARELAETGKLAVGTMDTWLIFNLTKERAFRTDFSNASRTQLFNINTLTWDQELLEGFDIPADAVPEVCMSDSVFGTTDLGGILPSPVPICGVLGDSHGALFGHNCRQPGGMKATYGTGSSVMINIGEKPRFSDSGLVTSLAWGIDGKVDYVFEGNINYTGAVISWLKNDVGLITSPGETGTFAAEANPDDTTYFVPAFTGLGAPYWDPDATGLFTGITRTTGKKELVKACVECIAYQITDLVQLMRKDSGLEIPAIHVDGGPTANAYLMQFQSDLADAEVRIPELEELSGMGAAYLAGMSAGLYDPDHIYDHIGQTGYAPKMDPSVREQKLSGWKEAVKRALSEG